jgi:hypothetical protein
MPDAVAAQRALLERLLAAAMTEPGVTGLTLGCSLARGAGDRWSDVDAGLAVDTATWPSVVDRVATMVGRLGEVADLLVQRWPEGGSSEAGSAGRHVVVQYVAGLQLSLVVMPGERWRGRAPAEVVLYDADGSFAERRTPSVLAAGADDVREWAFLGWLALADLVKYVSRRSPWEAMARLDDARTQVWRLWAVAHGVDYPVFGLTAALDSPDAGVPAGLDRTVAGLDSSALLAAARVLAGMLEDVSALAVRAVPAELPHGMARHVRSLLATATTTGW